MKNNITLNIDGVDVKASGGDTILVAAQKNGIDIPNLCFNKDVSCTAACRLCIVEIDGRPGLHPSCAITAEDGMKIRAYTDEIENKRRVILDLLLSSHNDDCINCEKDGVCELQDLAFKYDLGRDNRDFSPIWEPLKEYSDNSSQVLNYDASKCIQCQRCVKACQEKQGKGILTFANRGIKTTVSTGHLKWDESLCDGCGECQQVCPVGALTVKPVYTANRIRQKDIEKTTQTTCPYCGVGCQLNVSTIKDKIVKVDGIDEIPNNGSTCVKGRFGLDFVNHPDRLTSPLIRKNDKLVEVSWDEALDYTAEKLKAIKEKHGSDSICGLSSARCTNEDNYLFQKFIRAVVGTNNVDHCARLCHASTVAGLAAAFGSGAMTNSIAELENADVILVTGSNTTEAHPVIATHIKRAVLNNNAKLIVVDPRRIDLVKYAAVWLRQKNGTDVAWLNGLMNCIINENIHNAEFIKERTEGFEQLKKTLKKYTPEYVEKITSIPAEDLMKAAKIYGGANSGSIVYSMGITQHTNGTDNVKSVANLAMITGNIGRESTGVNPLRGQNNVQGACDMGALSNVYPGYQKVVDNTAGEKFEKAWGTELSKDIGLTIVEMMNAIDDGSVKAMYVMGENPVISDPNANHVKHVLKSIDFLVCQDIFLTETAELADVVFPSASFAEKDGTFTNTERRVLKVNKFIKQIGDTKPDWEIIKLLANKMQNNLWKYNSWKDILEEINSLTPQYGGITSKRIMKGEKLQWPCPDANHPGTEYLHKGKFTRGLGLLVAIDHTPSAESPDKKYPFVLSTGRSLFHYHTGSMTRRSRSLNGYVPNAYCEISKNDMQRLNITNGEKIKVSSRRGEIELAALQSEKPVDGSVFIPFHFAEAAANKLTIDKLDPIAKIPEYKVCAVSIEKA